MAQVWINPAFKNKVKPKDETSEKIPEPEKTEKTQKEPEKTQEKKTKETPKKNTHQETPEKKETRLFNYLRENQIPVEAQLTGELTIKGTVKWFSDWILAMETNNKTTMINRLNLIYYRYKAENIPPEKELQSLPLQEENPAKKILQEYKDNKTPLHFHLLDNIKIKGTFRWYEKLTCHIRSLDEKEDFNIHRSSLLYFEEA